MIKVGILVHPQCALFELGCAVELFAIERPEFPSWYEAEAICFAQREVAAKGAGIQLQMKSVTSLREYDMLVIPSWSTYLETIDTELKKQIIGFHQDGKRMISFCSGAFLLAQCGLLNFRQATTHWRYAQQLVEAFPAVDYVDNVLYTFDGLLGCSAGSAAALDLGIEVIRRDFGAKIANQVARRLVISAQRSGGQAQFVDRPIASNKQELNQATTWALKHLTAQINIDMLSQQASMSRRTFDRKFRSIYRQSPKDWLIQQRVELAKELLESTQASIEQVAEQSGFNNAMILRHHFKSKVGISPRRYRESFALESLMAQKSMA